MQLFRSKIFVYCTLLCIAVLPLSAFAGDPAIEGRWDATVMVDGKAFPSWVEIYHSGHKRLVGHYVGISGSARPVASVEFSNNKLHFSLPPQWEAEDNDLIIDAALEADTLRGTLRAADGKTYPWSAHRAPALRKTTAPSWGKTITLFNGKDLKGWHALGNNQWVVEPGGILHSPKSGANLVTDEVFQDFKLHIEFRCPPGSNSGIYLRGRYEVQIEDSYGKEPQKDYLGAIYGFLTPSEMAAKPANEWQTYDITLVGRMVTVVLNGKEIICNQAIPGITGGALDSNEGVPGPIYIQGDHGPIEYRNIAITPAK
ncbi:3-keto-disaccharide hydrolase [Flavihumibacter petaseus]|uniref:3-keto-alpha-glucoside-1,2-lyase/3-keto-2-hydroxy-glucal hydratase domain-containing protein n=1 Tax=Flavihumibacter petaseus NBRC 106054 TaxID=1220578 RepID=A0A0E9N1I3_9BACT|nr:DUF1080 domain-containing protein [Flavihumibacter petaseus]GAO43205.1 hypothetical protein FPE01S_02_03090 [Flavihumibacter petaseus NBRC 106054]